MQINFKLNNPKPLNGSFIYERTFTHSEQDEIDKVLILFVKNISSSISNEPLQLEINSSVNISNFQPEMFNFNSIKTINLIFKNSENLKNDKQIFQIDIYITTTDLIFINNLINENYTLHISEKSFKQLNTLITK